MTCSILVGDCRLRMKELANNSVDSVVCDPPYHLTSIVKRFGSETAAPAKVGQTGAYARHSTGFMGQKWDGGDIAQDPAMWAEVLRVLKPGGHLVAFSGTRTQHRMVCAIEDAGFEIRDQLAWAYGSGFPKSLDVSKAIDKAAGKLGAQSVGFNVAGKSSGLGVIQRPELRSDHPDYEPYSPATNDAEQWQGWGTALKPSWEPICLARKPLSEKSVAANVLKHGTGALNIDGCRIETTAADARDVGRQINRGVRGGVHDYGLNKREGGVVESVVRAEGRWPANFCHDGSDEVLAGFPETGPSSDAPRNNNVSLGSSGGSIYGKGRGFVGAGHADDGGSAARFFYCAKATGEERGEGNNHPTVKPIALMRWLCRLVTPPGGTILDPFMGSGSTLIAADAEQFHAIGCEMSPEYAAIAERRIRDAAGMFADVKVAA